MVFEISCCILIGLLSFATGSPDYRQNVYSDQNQYGLQKLLESLYKQGNYDISLSHHEDMPSFHHEDKAKIIYNSQNEPSSHVRNSDAKPTDSIIPSLTNIQSFYDMYSINPTNELRSEDNNNDGECMQIWGKCSDIKWNDTVARTKKYTANVNDILEFLNTLERYLEYNRNYNYKLRCYGNSCGKNRDDFYTIRNDYYDRKIDNNRNSYYNDYRNSDYYSDGYRNFNYGRNKYSNGNSYSNYDNNRNMNRNNNYNGYGGQYYNRNRLNYNKNIYDNYRNYYDKYSRNDAYDSYNENYNRYNLRCKGKGCSRGRSRNVRIERDNLRCAGNLCGRFIDNLRCSGDTCGRSKDNRDILPCIGDKCSRRTDDRDENDTNDDRYITGDNQYDDADRYNREDYDRIRNERNYIYNINDGNYGFGRGRDDRGDRDDSNERYDSDDEGNRDVRYYKYGTNNKDDSDEKDDRNDSDDRDGKDNRDDRDDSNDRDSSDGSDREDRAARDSGYDRDYSSDTDDTNDQNDSILRCLGNRCNRNDDDRSIRNSFHCVGNLCSRLENNRDDDSDDDTDGSSRDDDPNKYNRDILRCIGDKCARTRDDEDETDVDKEKDDNKMNVIFEMAGVDNLLANLKNLGSQLVGSKLPENIALNRLLEDRESILNQVKKLLTQNH